MAELRLDVVREDDGDDLCGWQLRIILDDVDITRRGCGMDPDELLPAGLAATVERRRVVLVRCGCGDVGCGSTSAVIVRQGDQVLWVDWQTDQGGRAPQDVHFDAAAYDSEVRRAHLDRAWEPEPRRIARQAQKLLTREVVDALAAHGLRDPRVIGTDDGAVEVWFDTGQWEHGHWQVFVEVRDANPLHIVEGLVATPPSQWRRVTWLPNDEVAMREPPPMAGPAWRRSPFV